MPREPRDDLAPSRRATVRAASSRRCGRACASARRSRSRRVAPAPVPITTMRPCGASRRGSSARLSPPTSSRITSYSPSRSVVGAERVAARRGGGARCRSPRRRPRRRAARRPCRRRRPRRSRAAARRGAARACVKSASCAVANASMKPPACGQSSAVRDRQRVPLVDDGQLGLAAAAEQRHHALAGPARPRRRTRAPECPPARRAAAGSGPARCIRSAPLIPAARTRIRSSPSPATGSGRSSISRRPSWMTTAFTGRGA